MRESLQVWQLIHSDVQLQISQAGHCRNDLLKKIMFVCPYDAAL